MGFRFVVMSVLWLSAFFMLMDRVNISMAAPKIIEELHLSGIQMGLILSAFYWGYTFGNPLGGILADLWPMRRTTTLLLGGWCLLTALTGLCGSLLHFYLIRGFFGLMEGLSIPFLHKIQNHWLSPSERGKFYGVYEGFARMGVGLGLTLTAWLIATLGWRAMFFLMGGLTILVVILFYIFVRDYPREHPWMSDAEKELIHRSLERDRVTYDAASGQAKKLSFREGFGMLMGDMVFWGQCLIAFFVIALYFGNLAWLPGYLVKERGYTVLHSGIYLILPFMAGFAGAVVAGSLGDRLGRRSLVGMVCCFLACPSMLGVLYAGSPFSVVLWMSLAIFFITGAINSNGVLLFDLQPPEAFGTALGVLAGVGAGSAGLLAPVAIGYLLDLTGSFFWGFTILAFGILLSGVIFIPISFREKQVREEKAARLALAIH
ncbi:MAG: MFS transporter [Nitrospinae bacterium]|nr:MFS transporter [Nitrospinota bacterium]